MGTPPWFIFQVMNKRITVPKSQTYIQSIAKFSSFKRFFPYIKCTEGVIVAPTHMYVNTYEGIDEVGKRHTYKGQDFSSLFTYGGILENAMVARGTTF